MAQFHSRQLLTWALPTVAVLLSYLWYKKKRLGAQSDPGDTNNLAQKEKPVTGNKTSEEDLKTADHTIPVSTTANKTFSPTPKKSFTRSLSGVESTPIDIVLPVELRSTKSTSTVISDEDLDFEIEKIKSMRNGPFFGSRMDNSPPTTLKTPPSMDENRPPSFKISPKEENTPTVQKDIDVVVEEVTSLSITDNEDAPLQKEQNDSAGIDREHVELQQESNERERKVSAEITKEHVELKQQTNEMERKVSAEITKEHVQLKQQSNEGERKVSAGISREHVALQQQSNERGREDIAEINRDHANLPQQSRKKGPKNNAKINKKHVKSQRQSCENEINENSKTNIDRVELQLQSSERTRNDGTERNVDLQRQSSERDSANPSPADVMLASPSLSSMSDNNSEGSSDSGKGGSDVATPSPSNTPGIDVSSNELDIHDFAIHHLLVGRLIGRFGYFAAKIKKKTKATIIVNPHPNDSELEICSVEGTQTQISHALKMIRGMFPLRTHPELTLERVQINPVTELSIDPSHLYVNLIEGITNDTVLSCMVAPNHLFLHQPTHPSFPNLHILSNYMNTWYSGTDSPMLPTPIPENTNTICVAYSVNAWCRAMILSTDVESDMSFIKLLDCGGYTYVANSQLRQIRQDFMLLPFQASECVLSHIRSINGDGSWPVEAFDLVRQATMSRVLSTRIDGYSEDGTPFVSIYIVVGCREVIYLNQHLVDNGVAEWIPVEIAQYQEQDCTEGAVGGA